ncbi:hypothetical protein DPMN_132820 [Dreissena polymorpha]|uniref:Uncharacterized protein n=1 Tax=Dreissena polymorpha TaxID=45954 RepID=A0A9D4FT60_DREPO|nr:hypothetical protein DPMN_132820 [Dreissena polymorpha]
MFLMDQNQFQTNYTFRENCPESHIFPPILTIFKLVHDINKTNILIKFHDRENIHVRKTAPPPWRPCFSTDQNHFLNVTSRNSVEFHEDRTRNAVSSVHKAKVHDGHRSIKHHHEHLSAYVS